MIRRLPTSDQSFVVYDTALTDHKPHISILKALTRQSGYAKLRRYTYSRSRKQEAF